jgi:hypothetical protein
MSCLQRAHSKLAGRINQPVTSSAPSSAADDDDPSLPTLLC